MSCTVQPKLALDKGPRRRRAPRFQIGSPGREDDSLRQEAARLLSNLSQSLRPPRKQYALIVPGGLLAIQMLKCYSQYTSNLLKRAKDLPVERLLQSVGINVLDRRRKHWVATDCRSATQTRS